MSKITNTGYWTSDNAEQHHVNSQPLSDWLCNFFKGSESTPIYDFGCGMGFYASNLRKSGFKVTGYEGDPPQKRFLADCVKQDLTQPFTVPEQGNVVFLEVAEHIPAQFEKAALDNVLAAVKDKHKLVLSWAVRGQAGFGHVNCLDNDEVITKIEGRGFKYLKEVSEEARKIDLDTAPWFRHTIMVFEKV